VAWSAVARWEAEYEEHDGRQRHVVAERERDVELGHDGEKGQIETGK